MMMSRVAAPALFCVALAACGPDVDIDKSWAYPERVCSQHCATLVYAHDGLAKYLRDDGLVVSCVAFTGPNPLVCTDAHIPTNYHKTFPEVDL